MASFITLQQARTSLSRWIAASEAVASNQSYEIDGRKLTRANAKEVREMISFWEAKVRELENPATGGRARARRIVFG